MSILNARLSRKLPLVIVGLTAVSILLASFLLLQDARRELITEQENKLVALQSSRAYALKSYLSSIQSDLTLLANQAYLITAMREFKIGWDRLEEEREDAKKWGAADYLRRVYINQNEVSTDKHPLGNPHPAGEKLNYPFANDNTTYSLRVHKRYHPWFKNFLLEREYYDIFLVEPDGDLVYSVFKELDFATNLRTGKYSNTDLGNAFKAAVDGATKDKQYFFDFKPYAPSANAPASFISQALFLPNGQIVGVLIFQMPIDRINAVMQLDAGLGETGETYIAGQNGLMRNDSRFRMSKNNGDAEDEDSYILRIKASDESIRKAYALKDKNDNSRHVHFTLGRDGVKGEPAQNVLSAYGLFEFMGATWAIFAEMDKSEIMHPINKMYKVSIVQIIILLTLVSGVGLLVARSIVTPITNMSAAMEDLAKGDFEVEVPGTQRSDEIGDMAAAVQLFKENGIEAKRLEEEQLKVEQRSAEEKTRLMSEMADQFDEQVGSSIESLSQAAEGLQSASSNMENTARETETASNSVAAAAEETSVNVSTVASATDEMTASALEISKQVSDVASKASMASSSAMSTSGKVTELNQLVENIGEVVNAIRDIADQTNLLALNATIEAARAGEAGKGFAVVAEEVKKLATETGQKTDEIEERISEIQQATTASVSAMQEIISHITDIDAASTGSSAAVEEQNSVIQEITRSISEVSEASSDVARVIGSVQAASSETGQASQSLRASSDDIAQLSDKLDQSVKAFLGKIRSS